ncbi:MAG: SRPBCC family protein [Bacteroidetes bacterium]|nr:SRPBCC family protein [Bacteroidota bacterium]MDA0874006.1 SRPBCC family protein [Bacteroidota bacterium]
MRSLRIALVLTLAAGVFFVSLGFFRPTVEVRTAQLVTRSPHVTFFVLTDGDRLDEWMEGFVSMERMLDRESRVGNRSVLRLATGSDTLELKQEVLAFEPGRQFQVRFEGESLEGTVDVELTPVPSGTEIMTTTRMEGATWWWRSMLPFLTGGLRQTQTGDYARLAALINTADTPLTGSWAGVDQWGNEQLFHFRPDGEVRWEAAAGDERFALDGVAWTLDRSSQPMRLDLTRFETGPLLGMGLYGIVEFISDDSLRVDLEAGPEGKDDVRPAGFTESSVFLRRIH